MSPLLYRITVQKHERFDSPPFHIIRLAGSGAGAVEPDQVCTILFRGKKIADNTRVASVRDAKLRELTEEDAKHVLRPPRNSLADLRAHLTQLYRTRPQWDEEDTVFRIVELEY